MSKDFIVIYKDDLGRSFIERMDQETLNNRLKPDEVGNCYFGRTDNIYFLPSLLGGCLDMLSSRTVIVIKGGEVVQPEIKYKDKDGVEHEFKQLY